jgi:hypothetical protein
MSISEIILWSGGTQVVITGFAVFISKIIQERILMRWKQNLDKEMAAYQNNLQRHDLLLSQTLATINQGNALLADKRIKIIETLWPAYLEHKESFGSILGLYGIYLPTMVPKLYESKFKGMINNINRDEILFSIGNLPTQFGSLRPFIGESLWQTVLMAASFYSMATLGLVDSFKKGKIIPWTEDKASLEILERLLSPAEFEYIKKLAPVNFDIASRNVDAIVLREISKFLSNEEIAQKNYQTSKAFLEVNFTPKTRS